MEEQDLGRRIWASRKLRGLSQEELSSLTDLTPPYISHIERGVKTPSLHALIRLADALGVSMDWLLGRERPAAEQQVITEIALTCRDILREGLPKE